MSPAASASGDRSPEVHVVAHTHWDREWYWSSGKSRQRLVALLDSWLTLPDETAEPFLLDGQAITLSDYLAIREERRVELEKRLARGGLEAGPWYVLADNLIPSGEAIVRNLQAGRRVVKRLGAHAPDVAYCPDSFGHPAAMPLIARGFGLRAAVVWRGYGGAGFEPGDSFVWKWPDGTGLPVWHLPRDGYEFGRVLPVTSSAANERHMAIQRELLSRSSCGVVMLPNGADHHALQPDVTLAVNALEKACAGKATVVRSSLSGFVRCFTAALLPLAEAGVLPTVHGELRNSYGYTWTLQGTFGTRAQDKRNNARLERLLLHDIEPLAALVLLRNGPGTAPVDGSVGTGHLVPFISCAWDTLLVTHPHDTLCGCSLDAAAIELRRRQRDVEGQCEAIRDDATCLLLACDRVASRDTAAVKTAAPVVLRNLAARRRSGVARIRILETLADVPVGPGSAPDPSHAPFPGAMPHRLHETISTGPEDYPPLPVSPSTKSTGLPLRRGGNSALVHLQRESPQHYPDNDLVAEHTVLAYVSDVPATGVAVVRAEDLDAVSPGPPVTLSQETLEDGVQYTLSNGLVTVKTGPAGISFSFGEVTLQDALWFETQSDLGDSYTPSLRGNVKRLRPESVRPGSVDALASGLLLGFVARDERGEVDIQVCATVSLEAGKPYVLIEVHGQNRRHDHRLRMGIATGSASSEDNGESRATRSHSRGPLHVDLPDVKVYADAAFGPVERLVTPNDTPGPAWIPESRSAVFELPLHTMPLHRWVSAVSGTRGVTLVSDGLAECEVDGSGITVTLLRAIGELSRNDLPERPGHAGWPISIPDAQSQGAFEGKFGVLTHGAWDAETVDTIEYAADDILLPLVGESFRTAPVETAEYGGLELRGGGLRLQAFMPSQDGASVVARIVNLCDTARSGELILPHERCEGRIVRLDETPLTLSGDGERDRDGGYSASAPSVTPEWGSIGRSLTLELAPRSVLTLQLRLRQ